MIQHTRKDYLQRLIEEFFAGFHDLLSENPDLNPEERKVLLMNGLSFFSKNLDVSQSDQSETLVKKIKDHDLLEQYARLLYLKFTITDIKESEQLQTALEIIRYLEKTSTDYSWGRTILKEDLLHLLEE